MLNNHDYERVERAIVHIMSLAPNQPSLGELAKHVGISEFHMQRLFRRWAGVTPKQFSQCLTLEYAKGWLRNSATLLQTAYGVGLSGTGRLHDLFVTVEAVTPAEYQRAGNGLEIRYGTHPSPFGPVFIATTARGICDLNFVRRSGTPPSVDGAHLPGEGETAAFLAERWPNARVVRDQSAGKSAVERIFSSASESAAAAGGAPLKLFLRGTNFQVNVWKALLRVPQGALLTYEELAAHAGTPRAVRAVGTAVGSNPIAFLIPCHRVIRKSGDLGNYGGGPARKRAILAWEAGRTGILEADAG